MTFRGSALRLPVAALAGGEGETDGALVDRGELARVSFAVLLVAAWAIYLTGGALAGGVSIRHGRLMMLVAGFAILSLVSAILASNKRDALNSWFEQATILSAGVLAIQLCAERRRFGLFVAVLAAVGAALALKGLYQTFVETPQQVAAFGADPTGQLREAGVIPGTPDAKLIEARIRDPAPLGFFSLANLLASLLIVLLMAACGLAADKLAEAVRSRRSRPAGRKTGEIHLPTLAAVLAVIAAAPIAAVLVLTRSRGAIASAGVAAVAAAVVWPLRRRLAPHRRKLLVAAGVIFTCCIAAVVAYGEKYDRLPTRTMTFRWYYWTASARIVRDKPLWGVGPGNFPSAYLQYRRPAAEEAVKMPHNVITHAASQYGLAGAALYLVILAYVIIAACAPTRSDNMPSIVRPRRRVPLTIIALPLVVLAVRVLFADAAGSPALLVVEAVLPAVALAVMLVVMLWAGEGFAPPRATAMTRTLLACGLVGFVLHNMVTFSLWTPATALVFWTAAGACLSQTWPSQRAVTRRLRWPAAALGIAAVAAAVVVLWLPVYRRTALTEFMAQRLRSGNIPAALHFAERAAEADSLDPLAAADAAWLAVAAHRQDTATTLDRAYRLALQAVARDEANYARCKLAAQIAWELNHIAPAAPTRDDALGHMAEAVRLNPQDIRLRLAAARMLCDAQRYRQCLEQLDMADQIESQLLSDSVQRFTPDERRRIEQLRVRAGAPAAPR